MAAANYPPRQEMAAKVFQQELTTVLHWFTTWSKYERQQFMADLLNKAVSADVTSLFEAMEKLNVSSKPPSIFQCQLKLFSDWFQEWSHDERDAFVDALKGVAPDFMREMYAQLNSRITEQLQCDV